MDAGSGGMNLARLHPLVLLVAAACGSTITEPDDGGAGGSGASDGPGAGNQGGDGAGNDGGNDTGGGSSCSDFKDAPDGEEVRISIRNDTPFDVFLPADCNSLDFTMRRAGQEEDYFGNVDGFCLTTCEDLQTGSGVECEPCAPAAVQIQAFSSFSVIWRQTGVHFSQMPASCWQDDISGPDASCSQLVPAEAGAYTLEALGVYNQCQDCECQDDICFGFPSGTQAFTADLPFTLPVAGNSLEYVIDQCAFGCPEPADG